MRRGGLAGLLGAPGSKPQEEQGGQSRAGQEYPRGLNQGEGALGRTDHHPEGGIWLDEARLGRRLDQRPWSRQCLGHGLWLGQRLGLGLNLRLELRNGFRLKLCLRLRLKEICSLRRILGRRGGDQGHVRLGVHLFRFDLRPGHGRGFWLGNRQRFALDDPWQPGQGWDRGGVLWIRSSRGAGRRRLRAQYGLEGRPTSAPVRPGSGAQGFAVGGADDHPLARLEPAGDQGIGHRVRGGLLEQAGHFIVIV